MHSYILVCIVLTEDEVVAILSKLNPNKEGGPDGIPCKLYNEVTKEIATSLCGLLNLSPSLGVMAKE